MSQPNILFILTDDQGPWAMRGAGNADLATPTLDRLATEGTRLRHCFCASPVCSPARASLLTGTMPSFHGVHDWLRGGNTVGEQPGSVPVEYLAGITGYTELLAEAGYVCGLSGKWHLGDSARPQQGHRYWAVHARGGGPYYGAPMIRDGREMTEPRYVTDAITDNAITFLERFAAGVAPFYLGVHYTAPHSPWGRNEHPAEWYDRYFDGCDFAAFPKEPRHPWQINTAPQGYDEESRREILSGYCAAISAMDANVGRLLDWLQARGLREQTLVVFTSDNGMNMGHHGVFGKGNGTFPQNMYDTSVMVPALFSQPGTVPAGAVAEQLVSHYDFMPTLLALIGLQDPGAAERPGRSFAGLLQGLPTTGERRDSVVVCDEYGPTRMLRTERFKYVHRYPWGPHELFDLQEDPDERVNLVADPTRARLRNELRLRLQEWFVPFTDPRRDGSQLPVTGFGQLRPVGPVGGGEDAFHIGG